MDLEGEGFNRYAITALLNEPKGKDSLPLMKFWRECNKLTQQAYIACKYYE